MNFKLGVQFSGIREKFELSFLVMSAKYGSPAGHSRRSIPDRGRGLIKPPKGDSDRGSSFITTVFVDTRLWKTKHPRKRFQNFRQSCVLSTDWIEIHQSQPASIT